MTSARATGSQTRLLILVLAAFALHVVWVPAHLAAEPHSSSGTAHALGKHAGHEHGELHHQGTGPEEPRHDPHPASDHDTELYVSPSSSKLVAASAVPVGESRSLVAMLLSWLAAEPRTPVPRGHPPGPGRARAPPTP